LTLLVIVTTAVLRYRVASALSAWGTARMLFAVNVKIIFQLIGLLILSRVGIHLIDMTIPLFE